MTVYLADELTALHTGLTHGADQCADLYEPSSGHDGWENMGLLMRIVRRTLDSSERITALAAELGKRYPGVDTAELTEIFERTLQLVKNFDIDGMDIACDVSDGARPAPKINGFVQDDEIENNGLGDWPERVANFSKAFLKEYNAAAALFLKTERQWIKRQLPAVTVEPSKYL